MKIIRLITVVNWGQTNHKQQFFQEYYLKHLNKMVFHILHFTRFSLSFPFVCWGFNFIWSWSNTMHMKFAQKHNSRLYKSQSSAQPDYDLKYGFKTNTISESQWHLRLWERSIICLFVSGDLFVCISLLFLGSCRGALLSHNLFGLCY